MGNSVSAASLVQYSYAKAPKEKGKKQKTVFRKQVKIITVACEAEETRMDFHGFKSCCKRAFCNRAHCQIVVK